MDKANGEFQELRWWMLAILKRRDAADDELREGECRSFPVTPVAAPPTPLANSVRVDNRSHGVLRGERYKVGVAGYRLDVSMVALPKNSTGSKDAKPSATVRLPS